jgi:hypothetical protein
LASSDLLDALIEHAGLLGRYLLKRRKIYHSSSQLKAHFLDAVGAV